MVDWLTVHTLFILFISISSARDSLSSSMPYSMPTVYLAGSGEKECINQLEKVARDWSGYIYSHKSFPAPYMTDRNCFLLIMADPTYRIRLTVLDFNIRQSDGCKEESLAIFDQDAIIKSEHDSPGPIKGQYCGSKINGTTLVESKFNALTLWWHTAGEKSRGFRLFWTLFRDKPPEGCSATQELECGNDECIPVQVACDSVAHCHDATDIKPSIQRKLGCRNIHDYGGVGDMSKFALAGICVSIVVGSVLICVIASVCCRDICRRHHSGQMSTITGTESSHSPQPLQSRLPSKPYYSRTPIYGGQTLLIEGHSLTNPYANGRTGHNI